MCFFLTWTTVVPVYAEQSVITTNMTEQELRKQYPNAKVINVEQEDYAQLAESLRSQGYTSQRSTEIEQANTQDAKQDTANNHTTSNKPECNDELLTKSSSQKRSTDVNTAIDISDGILDSGGSGGDAAVIVFVIIGAIVIVVWALYVFKYLYDLSTGFTPCEYWYQLTYTSSSISSTEGEFFDMDGLRFTTGFRDDGTDVGIALEMGDADILLLEDTSTLNLDGFYWMLGPTLRWRLSTGYNPHYLHMNFMGGTTQHDEIGVLAKATIGFQIGLGKHFHLGFNFGAMNINLNDELTVISDDDQYHFLYGINSGFRF